MAFRTWLIHFVVWTELYRTAPHRFNLLKFMSFKLKRFQANLVWCRWLLFSWWRRQWQQLHCHPSSKTLDNVGHITIEQYQDKIRWFFGCSQIKWCGLVCFWLESCMNVNSNGLPNTQSRKVQNTQCPLLRCHRHRWCFLLSQTPPSIFLILQSIAMQIYLFSQFYSIRLNREKFCAKLEHTLERTCGFCGWKSTLLHFHRTSFNIESF